MFATPRANVSPLAIRRILVLAFALALAGAASRAEGACTVRIESNVAFGSYDVFSASPLNSTGQISYRCTGTTKATIQISLSRGISPTYSPRQLRHGADVLSYNLYRDAACTIIWGDGTAGTQIYSAPRATGRIYVSIYGRVPAAQDAAVGPYSDTVVVTVNY